MFRCIFNLPSHTGNSNELWIWISKAWVRGWGRGRRRQRPDPQQTLLQARGDSDQLFWWLEDPHHSKRRRNTGHQPLEPDKTPTSKLDPTEKLDFFEPSGTHQEFSTSHIHQTLSAILLPPKNLKGKPNTSVKIMSGFSFNRKFPKFSSNATESERTPFSPLALTHVQKAGGDMSTGEQTPQ